MKNLLIAVDGPAASGKGTLAKSLAQHFNIDYLDTGRLYRLVGYKLLKMQGELDNKELAVDIATKIKLHELENENLYNVGVGNAASIISSLQEVRDALFDFQKNVARSKKGAVLDGRDIGTIICPNADFKFFINAALETRAKRRYKQLQIKDKTIIYDHVFEDLQRRDERDSKRSMCPLSKASDAIYIDSTNMNASEVLSKALSFIES